MIQAARRIVQKLKLNGHEAFFAGGWVRDTLLHRKPKDIDIATTARPDEVRQLFPKSTSIGAEFGVIQVQLYGCRFEVATFRSDEVYLDGRHPSSVTFSNPREDALRRDFTMNGLFYDPEIDRVIDYVRGRSDIRKRLIRAIGDPFRRFNEDKLRMMRAIRFACTLDFKITEGTWHAILELAPRISSVSWERIRDELIGILTGPKPGLGLNMLHESGLLKQILPEVDDLRNRQACPGSSDNLLQHTAAAMDLLMHPYEIPAFGCLLHALGPAGCWIDSRFDEKPSLSGKEIVAKICRRLRISRKDTDRIAGLVGSQALLLKIYEMRESDFKRFLRQPHFDEIMDIYRVHCISLGLPLDVYQYCKCMHKKCRQDHPSYKPLLKGEDLIREGYRPGPAFKKILKTVEDLQLERKITTRKEAIRFVRATFPKRKQGHIDKN
ncbi:MAG: CCA tRNA nucleotidyltransferase [Acidobacteriota bacterium]